MSLLIKGMEMPEENHDYGGVKVWVDLRVYTDGSVSCRNLAGDFVDLGKCAVEVPTPHGRLIDADAFNDGISKRIEHLQILEKHDNEYGIAAAMHLGVNVCHVELKLAPTVIEAEEG